MRLPRVRFTVRRIMVAVAVAAVVIAPASGIDLAATRSRALYALQSALREELGGDAPARFKQIHGQVTHFGRPVGGGWIEVLPTDGTLGVLDLASIDRAGTFHLSRVPVGRVAINLTMPSLKRRAYDAGDRMSAWSLSGLQQAGAVRRVIKDGENPRMRIELEVEQVLYEELMRKSGRLPAWHPGPEMPISRTLRP